MRMTNKEKISTVPTTLSFTALGQALMESFSDGVAVFDPYGRLLYANEHARRMAGIEGDFANQRADTLRPRLLALGGRATPLRSGPTSLGEAVFVPRGDQAKTLADRERQAIVETLHGTSGKLAETARRLGISRTTLWRRLKAYGLKPENGGSGPAGGNSGGRG